MQPKGALIDTVTLYSEHCPALLRQALEREEQAKAEGTFDHHRRQPHTQFEDASDSDSNLDGGEDDEPSDGSLSDNEEQQLEGNNEKPKESSTQIPEGDPSSSSSAAATAASASNNRTPPPTASKPKTARPSQTQQQQQFAVKKYLDSLTCEALPINDTEALHLPSSLLSKQQESGASIADRNYVAESPCRDFLKLSQALQDKPVVVILLRSGRFAAAVFQGSKCIVHRACQRYTVRKGQGKAQSAQDGNRRPKSMGAQLRRAGEENLQQDIEETMKDWKPHIQKSALVLLSCPKAMKKYLFEAMDETILTRDDTRIRRLPLDMGRPTFESVCMAHQVMMTVALREFTPSCSEPFPEEANTTETQQQSSKTSEHTANDKVEKKPEVIIPLTVLHEACQRGDLDAITELLSNASQAATEAAEQKDGMPIDKMINLRAGPDFMTCLHYAAESATSSSSSSTKPTTTSQQPGDDEATQPPPPVEPSRAAECVTQMLVEGKADPGIVDARRRPPYFLASHDKIREAFRMARAALGEGHCRWDEDAKVGPPLTEEDIEARKQKEAEKKKKKKARQKQKKAEEKAEEEQERRQREEAEATRKQQEDAKRVRDGLKPKTETTSGTVCDFCQTVVKGRKRKDMFSRLEYVYCSADCVQKHKRELMAAAAMARFG